MNVLVFRTTLGEDVLAEVLEQQQNYYLVNNPIMIVENMVSGGSYVGKWVKYNDSDKPVKVFINSLAAVAEPNPAARKQYIDLIEAFKAYMADQNNNDVEVNEDGMLAIDTEGLTDEEAKQKLYTNVLQFIKKPEGMKDN